MRPPVTERSLLRYLSLALMLLGHLCAGARAEDPASSAPGAHTLRYAVPDAAEVHVIWGIDGWQRPPDASIPEGTVIEGGVMYTPMVPDGEEFTLQLRLPQGTLVDHVFNIRRTHSGGATDLWDTNGTDGPSYHAFVLRESESRVSREHMADISQPAPSGLRWLATLVMLALTVIIVAGRGRASARDPAAWGADLLYVVATWATALWILFIVRMEILGVSGSYLPLEGAPRREILGAFRDDAVYVLGAAAVFSALLAAGHRLPRWRLALRLASSAVAAASVLLAIVNLKTLPMIAATINWQWLYYSDFLGSFDARAAIAQHLSVDVVVGLVSAVLAVFCVPWALARVVARARRPNPMARYAATALVIAAAAWGATAEWPEPERFTKESRTRNATVAFVGSAIAFVETPALFTMETGLDSSDFESAHSPDPGPAHDPTRGRAPRHVVVVILESVGVRYLDVYGGAYGVTPNLARLREHAVLFDNIYAHAPATNLAAVSLLTSTYPWISYRSITAEYPDAPFDLLTSTLKARGFRTGFFNAGDNRFQKLDDFLAGRDIDRIEDKRSLACDRESFVADPKDPWFLNGLDDHCLVDALAAWIDEDPQRPFLGILWTYQTHYPYFVSGPPVAAGTGDATLDRYLGAIRHADAMIGRIVEGLEQRGLSDDTLLVIVGDHGEAFGQHGQRVHATHIYEENIHVPLMLVNGTRFRAEQRASVGGLVDVAPTILDLLDVPAPASWQGRSLFAADRSNRTYYFAPWSDFLCGVRQDDTKLIFNASKDSYELYDLRRDPGETANLAPESPELVQDGLRRLAAWVQHQQRFIESMVAGR